MNLMKLYDHQEKIIQESPKKALIALGTGGGKTRVCLELAKGKTLIICPKQQKLDKTWEENAKKFGIEIELVVISKEDFRRDSIKIPKFDTVIIDECHNVLGVLPDTKQRKGQIIPKSSQLFDSVLSFIRRTSPERFYMASATPVTKPMQLWALATLFGKKWDFHKFRSYFYFEKKIGFRSLWIPRNTSTIKQKLADLTKSFGYTGQLSDWFDVPEQHHETIYVELTNEQRNAIAEIESSEADPMAKRAKIRTIENGVLYDLTVETRDGDDFLRRHTIYSDNRKLEEISKISKRYDKLLIFAAFKGQINAIKRYLIDSGKYTEKEVWTLTGETKDRGTVIQTAEKASKAVVIAQASISAGYELPSFKCTIFASKSYRVVDYIQSLGRTLRANALKENFFYHLVVSDGMDEACHKAIMAGEDFQELLMTNV